MTTQGNWIDHFPGNFTWSNATLVCKGMAPWGAVALEEIDRIGEQLKARASDSDAWWQEWSAMAARLEQTADAAAAEGRHFTAGNYYIRAGNYYFTGERMVPPGEQKIGIYRKALRCFHAGLERRYPNIERVDVPYEGAPERGAAAPESGGWDRKGAHQTAVSNTGTLKPAPGSHPASGSPAQPSAGCALPAYFMKAPGAPARAPTVVVFDGLDNCKEMSVIFAGLEFARRGFNTLAIDGPGQGEALRLRNIHSRHDYEVAGTAAYEYVASRPDVDAKRVAVMAYSFGGYYAPRIAAFEQRYAACVVFGAVAWDIHAKQLERKRLLETDPKKTSQSPFQLPWVLGVRDMDEAIETVKRFTLVNCAGRITCPFLVTHGASDRLATPSDAEKLYAAVGSKNKTIKIFTAEEGAAEHCHVDNRQVGIDYVADWITATL